MEFDISYLRYKAFTTILETLKDRGIHTDDIQEIKDCLQLISEKRISKILENIDEYDLNKDDDLYDDLYMQYVINTIIYYCVDYILSYHIKDITEFENGNKALTWLNNNNCFDCFDAIKKGFYDVRGIAFFFKYDKINYELTNIKMGV